MAQLVVRGLEDEVKVRLRRRAVLHGVSMEEEVRNILRSALLPEDEPIGGLGTEISSMFREFGLDEPIAELRGYEARPASFDEAQIEE